MGGGATTALLYPFYSESSWGCLDIAEAILCQEMAWSPGKASPHPWGTCVCKQCVQLLHFNCE